MFCLMNPKGDPSYVSEVFLGGYKTSTDYADALKFATAVDADNATKIVGLQIYDDGYRIASLDNLE